MATQSVKDILNAEIPRPTFTWRPSRASTTGTDVTHTRNSPAWTYDPTKGLFVERSSGTPLSYGAEQGYLNNGLGGSNILNWISQINSARAGWSEFEVASETTVSSLFEGESANKITATSSGLGQISQAFGGFSGNREVLWGIFEKPASNASPEFVFKLRNKSQNLDVVSLVYNWGNDTLSTFGTSAYSGSRRVSESGPNGGPLVYLFLAITSGNSLNNTSDGKGIQIQADPNKNGGSVIAHHAQHDDGNRLRDVPPIVTRSSTVQREPDDVDLDLSGDVNKNKGTFLIEYTPITFVNYYDNILRKGGGDKLETGRGVNFNFRFRDVSASLNIVEVSPNIKKFEPIRIVLSINSYTGKTVLSVNGLSDVSGSYDGEFLKTDVFQIEPGSTAPVGVYHLISFFPTDISQQAAEVLSSV